MASHPSSQLRAQTGQDVLFAGSEEHAASGVCEVELVIDNSDGRVGIGAQRALGHAAARPLG